MRKATMEPALAMWHTLEDAVQNPETKIFSGEQRTFESVENAVLFVMETLSPANRATAMIQTDSRSIDSAEIEAIYDGLTQKT
jgi:hypothetical protein